MIDTPTLLIGLGGLGGQIAFDVYKRVPEKAREYIGLHIFDTDRNPDSGLGKPEFAPLWDQGMITQTSPPMLVAECYQALVNKTQVSHWFPMGDVIGQKPMPDGAGQVRAVSRLAFLDTLNRGDMRNLDATIEKLLVVRPQKGNAAFRVLIVNTLAGGTGSGIFLQVPMYVRHYLETMRGRSNVVIRNVSLLPGLFVNTGSFGGRKQQTQNVLANGYAAIKELDALMVARNSSTQQDEKQFIFPMEMEYLAGDTQAKSVGSGPSPYETIFLIDHINGNSLSLQNVSTYIQQAIDSIHLQLVSPLEGKINGQADNNVREIDKSDGRGRYASMGSASICYPYEDVVRYLALRWAANGLDEQWLKVDRRFRNEVEEARKKKKRDPSVEIPRLRGRYVDIIDAMASGPTGEAFFKQITRSTHIWEKEANGTERGTPKVAMWIHSVKNKIDQEMERSSAVALESDIDPTAMRRESTFVDEVGRALSSVENLFQKASSAIDKAASAVTNEVLWQDADAEPYVLVNREQREHAKHRLNTWMLMPGEQNQDAVDGMHPVAVRYFLCSALAEIQKRCNDCESETKNSRESLDGLRNKYDDPKTPAKETAYDKAMEVRQDLKWWKKNDQLKTFANQFERDVKQTVNLITSWASQSIEYEVLRRIKGVLEAMLDDWERFFNELGQSLRQSLQAEIEREERAHELGNPLTRFVLSSAESKQKFWQRVSNEFSDEGISPEVCARLYQAYYLRAVEHHNDPVAATRAMQFETSLTRRLFEDHVVSWCSQQLLKRDDLKLDLISAIRKEAELIAKPGTSDDAWLRERINEVRSIAAPWLPINDSDEPTRMVFWGVAPDIAKQLGGVEGALFKELLDKGEDNPVVNDEFSRYELKRFVAVYALTIQSIPAFKTNTGQYWRAYQDLRSETLSTPGKGMTPHADKRWDSPAFLREMDDDEQTTALAKLRLATLYAVMYKEVDSWRKDGQNRWRVFEGDRPVDLLMANGMPCPFDLIGLYLGLATHYRLVDRICAIAETELSRARAASQSLTLDTLPIVSKGHEVLIQILSDAGRGTRQDDGSQAWLQQLAVALADEVMAGALKVFGIGNPNTALSEASKALAAICTKVQVNHFTDRQTNILTIVKNRPEQWRKKIDEKMTKVQSGGVSSESVPPVFMG